jgi:hypothetical protein
MIRSSLKRVTFIARLEAVASMINGGLVIQTL